MFFYAIKRYAEEFHLLIIECKFIMNDERSVIYFKFIFRHKNVMKVLTNN